MITQEQRKKTPRALRKVEVLTGLLENVEILHNIRDDKREAAKVASEIFEKTVKQKEAAEKQKQKGKQQEE